MPTVAEGQSNHIAIGADGYEFCGTFDGAGYAIDNFKISSNAKISGTECIGGVVGKSWSGGSIKNCAHSGSVSGSSSIGGVVGNLNNSSVENCVNAGAVRGNSDKGVIFGFNYNGATLANAELTVPVGLTVVEGGAQVLNTIYTAAGETVTLQENISNENVLFAGIKGATPSGERKYSSAIPTARG